MDGTVAQVVCSRAKKNVGIGIGKLYMGSCGY
jgi:hypothetical protein